MNKIILSSYAAKFNAATKSGLNDFKAIYQGSVVPVLLIIVVLVIIFSIVKIIINNREGESPVKWILILLGAIIAGALFTASSGWF